MYIIGITGGTGSGKTTALQAVAEMGGYIIDCDAIYHELLDNNASMVEEIGARFEGTVAGGVLDRKKLGALVFSNKTLLGELSAITHKYVGFEIKRLLAYEAAAGRKLVAIDAIALIESGRGNMCNVTVAVTCPVPERVKRLVAREGISEEYARLRISAQKSDEWYAMHCDIVLENSGDKEAFKRTCLECFSSMLEKHMKGLV